MKKNLFKRGFTLIELLVVIAIIGILASVVLASLNNARDKGEDAAAKSALNNARAQAELYYDDNGRDYDTVCTTAATGNGIQNLISNASTTLNNGSETCVDNSGWWAAEVQLNSGQYYCVDFNGNAGEYSATSNLADTSTTTSTCDGA